MKRRQQSVGALQRLRKPWLPRAHAGLRSARAKPPEWARAFATVGPGPLDAALDSPWEESATVRALRLASKGGAAKIVPVDLAATVRGRVRKWPVLLINTLLILVATDLAGSVYLREAMGVKLLDAYRQNLVPPSASVITDANGHRIGELAAADAVREPVDKVPTIFHDALIRWEDARFLAHDGVDRYRMAGAVEALLKGDPQGGSTLTMQLAKLIKRDSARTLRRKMEDIALALAMDDRLGKEEVLRDYANQAYFGSGINGLGSACHYYFNREGCQGLKLEEAAYLVSLLRAPAELSKDPVRARARRNAVIEQMLEPDPRPIKSTRFDRVSQQLYLNIHHILEHDLAGRNDLQGAYPPAEIAAARQTPLTLARVRTPTAHPFVLETARQELQKKLGASIYEDGLDIRLTINSDVQKSAEHALHVGLDKLRELMKARGEKLEENDDLDGGVIVLDPRTGRMLAYVPGADFSTSQVPFAARPIQVGSALKPFIYGEMFDEGKGNIDTKVLDAPICFGDWCPKDYEPGYHGAVPVWFALSRSLNTSAVRVADLIGVDSIVARMRLLGVDSPLTANLPMALGASDITLLELAGMYGALYDGRVVRPTLVLDVKDRDNKVIYRGGEQEHPLAFQPSTIIQLHEAMGLVLGPGGTASPVGRELSSWFNLPAGEALGQDPGMSPQLACKTGTHTGFIRVGLGCVVSDTDYGPVVVVSYVGYRHPRSLGNGMTGGHVAGPIVANLIEALTVKTKASGVFRPFPKLEDEEESAPIIAKGPYDSETKAQAEGPRLKRIEATPEMIAAFEAKDRVDPLTPTPIASPPPAAELAVQPAPASVVASAPSGAGDTLRLLAPRDWDGLEVLDTDVVEASGPHIIQAFLNHGGHEEELTEIGPYLGLTVEHQVIHGHRLLAPGFADQPLAQRVLLLSNRVMDSLRRMLSSQAPVVTYSQPDPLTHILSEADADRRIERIYHFSTPIQMFRVTRHRTTGALLAVEWVDLNGARHAVARQGGRLAQLSVHHVLVGRGPLEPAWIKGGLSPASLDSLRALIGGSMSIDRIPRGFQLQLLLADGNLMGVEAERPPDHVEDPIQRVSAILTDEACLSQDGAPCARRLMPLPLAEAHIYGQRAATEKGAVLVQRDQPESPVFAPAAGRIVEADPDRDQIVIDIGDGETMRLDGIKPSVAIGSVAGLGQPIGRLDTRGVLVLRAWQQKGAGRFKVNIEDVLPELSGADDSLDRVSSWWRGLHAWLRGEGTDLGRGIVHHT